jgi:prepilin-type N-terminal cleavage/methylation domain-containing protein
MSIGQTKRQRGFTVLEAVVVVAIILIVASMTAPKMLQFSDNEKLRESAQAYASLLEVARMRATSDNQYYEVLTTTSGLKRAYVDINRDNSLDTETNGAAEPSVELPSQLTVTDSGAPITGSGFDTTHNLGIIPLDLENSPMLDPNGNALPGIAFNERGLPCQRIKDPVTNVLNPNCKNSTWANVTGTAGVTLTAWVTYLKYTNYNGSTSWAAVTVTPAGRIKTWSYNGSWQ